MGLFELVLLVLQALPQGTTGSIAGQISNANGTFAASVRVAAMPVDAQAANLSVLAAIGLTDSSGRYRIDNVDPGTYYITAGLVAQPTFYPGVATQSGARPVTVAAGASVTGLDFRVVTSLARIPAPGDPPRPTFSVSGNVILEPGQQLPPDTRVILGPQTVTIRPNGSFEVPGVYAGTYQLLTSPLFSRKPVTVVVVDKNVVGTTVTVPFMGRVTGSIESKPGPLSEPISLSIRQAGDPLNRVGISSAQAFALDLPEGAYRVVPEKLPEGYRIESLTVGTTNLQTDVLNISRGDNLRLLATVSIDATGTPAPSAVPFALPMRERSELSGRLEIEGAKANALVGIRLADQSGTRATAIIDVSIPNPVFKLAVPAGEYRVEVLLPDSAGQTNPFKVKSLTYGSSDILSTPLRITAGPPEEIRIVIMH